MYKRRDWLHLHGEDGGASDSSDDGASDGGMSSDMRWECVTGSGRHRCMHVRSMPA